MTPAAASLVIVTYNSDDVIPALLDELDRVSNGVDAQCVFVDSASTDGTVELIRSWMADRRNPSDVFVPLEENLGFPKAANIGASRATGTFLFFLNPDISHIACAIQACCRALDDPAIGICGPRLVDEDGTQFSETARALPSGARLLLRSLGLNRLNRLRRSRSNSLLSFHAGLPIPTPAISGAFMGMRTEVFKRLGPLDERLFMYLEDVEYALRVRYAGLAVVYLPYVLVVHAANSSRKTIGAEASELDQLIGEVTWLIARDQGRRVDASLATMGALFFAARYWLRGGRANRCVASALARWCISPKPRYIGWRPTFATRPTTPKS